MKEFVKLINNEDFIEFVLTDYFQDSPMTDEEKIAEVGSSLHDYAQAMTRFQQVRSTDIQSV